MRAEKLEGASCVLRRRRSRSLQTLPASWACSTARFDPRSASAADSRAPGASRHWPPLGSDPRSPYRRCACTASSIGMVTAERVGEHRCVDGQLASLQVFRPAIQLIQHLLFLDLPVWLGSRWGVRREQAAPSLTAQLSTIGQIGIDGAPDDLSNRSTVALRFLAQALVALLIDHELKPNIENEHTLARITLCISSAQPRPLSPRVLPRKRGGRGLLSPSARPALVVERDRVHR